jgi:dTDP-4-dehydrorhamnose reductase
MRIAIAGFRGRLGSWLFQSAGHDIFALDVDCADPEKVRAAVEESKPDVIINCVSWTKVNEAEDPANREAVIRANVRAPGVLRRAFGGYLVQMSSGFVFPGTKLPRIVDYNENAKPNPVNFYGFSKLGGEAAARLGPGATLIVRTLDLFGPVYIPGKEDFVQGVVRILRSGQPFPTRPFYMRQPTYIPELARVLLDIARATPPLTGILHLAGWPATDARHWAEAVADAYGLPKDGICGGYEPSVPRPFGAVLRVDKAEHLGIHMMFPTDALRIMARGAQ